MRNRNKIPESAKASSSGSTLGTAYGKRVKETQWERTRNR